MTFHVSSPSSTLVAVPLRAELGDGCLFLSDTALGFGAADPACSSGRQRTVTIRNQCSTDIYVDTLGVDPSAAADFSVMNAPPLGTGVLLRPFNDSLRFDVVFHPSSLGARAGTLRIGWRHAGRPTADLVALSGNGTAGGRQTDRFVQRDGQVDLLLALGNKHGPPFGPELVDAFRYADRMAVLLPHLFALGIDFQIAAVAMGTNSKFNPSSGGFLFWPTSPDPILTPASPSLLGQLQGKFVYDRQGNIHFDPEPYGHRSSLEALTPPHIDQINAGFLRDSARLAVLHVNSDVLGGHAETPPSHYLGQYMGLKGLDRPEDFIFGAFTALEPGCGIYNGDPAWTMDEVLDLFANPWWLAEFQYRPLAQATGGLLRNFCAGPGWEDDTETMVEVLTGVRLRFPLSQTPDLSVAPVEVRVDGVTVPSASPLTGDPIWTWEPARNRVRFEASHLPAKGSTVEIQYRTACE